TAGASEHGGKAAAALLKMSDWLMPKDAQPTLTRSQAYLTVALVAVDLSARGYEAVTERAQAQEDRDKSRDTSLMLAARVEALQGKARDLNKLLDMIAQEPRCR